jgi:hypothetical protein
VLLALLLELAQPLAWQVLLALLLVLAQPLA